MPVAVWLLVSSPSFACCGALTCHVKKTDLAIGDAHLRQEDKQTNGFVLTDKVVFLASPAVTPPAADFKVPFRQAQAIRTNCKFFFSSFLSLPHPF
ncbi:hypothetical protein GQ53DRAFT_751765 [Thozetella sp. PMI_491]|nr:hypothetical protein GQ53DRAFT_751765 [Thozetella sp. PMI_491]